MVTTAAAINENLAKISNLLVYSAIAVYTLAFLAHCAEWAFGSRSRVAKQSAALAAVPAADRPRVLAHSGGPAAAAAPEAGGRAEHGLAADGLASSGRAGDGPGAAGTDERADVLGRMAVAVGAAAPRAVPICVTTSN